MSIVVPYLSDAAIRERAEEVLRDYHVTRAIPVPIEQIVEFGFEMDIIPMPGFHRNFEVDAFISTDMTEIRVDQSIYEARNKNRYRFSLAHELSHRILHADILSSLRFKTIEEWKQSRSAMPEREYSRLEFQANTLAGLILVPPKELGQRFEVAMAHAESVGISLSDARPEAWDNIERWLANEFQVSQGVIARRAPKDGLWDVAEM